MKNYDLIVIGGGAAGMAAAVSACKNGVESVLIIERDDALGGILNQCIHNGFGLHYFKEELTGPEFAERFADMVRELPIEVKLNTMVLEITEDHKVKCMSSKDGYEELQAKAIVLAMGCRERTRGAIDIAGDRPAGIMTAGMAQRFVNMDGYMCGKKVLILGTGDIGLIMARRMKLEGAEVVGILARGSYPKGLKRNVVQCLEDFGIPLYLSHNITNIIGKHRIEKVIVAETDAKKEVIPGTEKEFDCDTVLLSVGLIPENELSKGAGVELDRKTSGAYVYENMETNIPGIFACGNVLHVHDLVDFVAAESDKAGAAVAEYIKNGEKGGDIFTVKNGDRVSYTVPQKIRKDNVGKAGVDICFRVPNIYSSVRISITDGEKEICGFNRDYMEPGEMEKVRVPGVLLDKASGDTLTVSIVDQEGK